MRKLATIVFTLVFAAAVVAACGSSGSSSSGGSSTAGLESQAGLTGKVNLDSDKTNRVASPTSGTQKVEQGDFYFGPAFIKAKPGTTLHISLKNAGTTPHTFTITSLHIDKLVNAGDTATVDVKVPSKGAVRFFCRFHQSMGMQGAIIAT
jgi:plastocyanin